jgi:hypothetical protein
VAFADGHVLDNNVQGGSACSQLAPPHFSSTSSAAEVHNGMKFVMGAVEATAQLHCRQETSVIKKEQFN